MNCRGRPPCLPSFPATVRRAYTDKGEHGGSPLHVAPCPLAVIMEGYSSTRMGKEGAMTVYRKWFCTCMGKPMELSEAEILEGEDLGEPAEPVCRRCGATPSSDPKRTVTYRDVEDWSD